MSLSNLGNISHHAGGGGSQNLESVLTQGNNSSIPINFTNEIDLQRQSVQYLSSDSSTIKLPVLEDSTLAPKIKILAYDTATKKVSYQDPSGGGGGGASTLQQTLTAGNTTSLKINYSNEVGIQRAGVDVINTSTLGPNVVANIESDALRLNKGSSSFVQGTQVPMPGAQVYVQNYNDSFGDFYSGNLHGNSTYEASRPAGTLGSAALKFNTDLKNLELRAYDQVTNKKSELKIDQVAKEITLDVDQNLNTMKLKSNGLSVKTLPLNAGTHALKYNNVSGEVSYDVSGGGGGGLQNLQSVLDQGNSTVTAINFTNNVEIMKGGNNKITSSASLIGDLGVGTHEVLSVHSKVLSIEDPVSRLQLASAVGAPDKFAITYTDINKTTIIKNTAGDTIIESIKTLPNQVRSAIDLNPTSQSLLLTANYVDPPATQTSILIDNFNKQIFLECNNSANQLILSDSSLQVKTLVDSNAVPEQFIMAYNPSTKQVSYQNFHKTSGASTLNGTVGITITTMHADPANKIIVQHNTMFATPILSSHGTLVVGDIIAGVSFKIYSTEPTDTNNVTWHIQ